MYVLFQSIKDYQLIGIVAGMSAVIVVILFIWELVGPQRLILKELTREVSLSNMCGSRGGTGLPDPPG